MSKMEMTFACLGIVVIVCMVWFVVDVSGQPRAIVTKIEKDGTVWISVRNIDISDNTSFYLYHDDIEKGKRLELVK